MRVDIIGKGLVNAVKIAKGGCNIILPLIGTMVFADLAKDVLDDIRYSGKVGYDDAVKAILDSGMFSNQKQEAISVLKVGENSDFYKAVISVARSSMLSYNKLETIKNMNKKNEEESQA